MFLYHMIICEILIFHFYIEIIFLFHMIFYYKSVIKIFHIHSNA